MFKSVYTFKFKYYTSHRNICKKNILNYFEPPPSQSWALDRPLGPIWNYRTIRFLIRPWRERRVRKKSPNGKMVENMLRSRMRPCSRRRRRSNIQTAVIIGGLRYLTTKTIVVCPLQTPLFFLLKRRHEIYRLELNPGLM